MTHKQPFSLLSRFVNRNFTSYEDFKENYRVKIPENFNFGFDVVDELAAEAPGQAALSWCNESGDSASFTFADIKKYSDKAASALVKLGIKKGDPVMLMLKRRYEFWFLCVALHKIGAVCIPATHMLTVKDLVYRNNTADIKMIITTEEKEMMDMIDESHRHSPSLTIRAALKADRPGWINISAAIEKGDENFSRPTGSDAADNSSFLLGYFTSGTTGMPKIVKHNYTYPLGHIITAAFWQDVQPGGLHLTVADTGWAKAAWGKIYGQWICGCAVMVYDYDKFMPKSLLKIMADKKITSFCAPPTIYRFFIKEDLSVYDFSNLKHCSVAGEPLNPEVYNQFLKQTGLKIKEGFGQSETVAVVATFPWLEPKPGSMGKPSPGFDVDLIDDNGKPCAPGEEGHLIIRTGNGKPAGMFDEYYRAEELTKKAWSGNIYRTGDMAYRDEDGFFWFVGRADDCFKSSGYRIGPFEIESALLEHPAVLECAITAVPDPDRGLVAKATVVLAKNYNASPELAKKLQEHVKKVTAPYKYPRIVEFVKELPKTISGKIKRMDIRKSEK
ncbi:MAG TPA: AMP-binding protein [Candidatus Goldiibacteriota bacterium]|nr:AMP-binding protein [Candidatus Goldiibacteriota bacterium]HRQ44529.1 AMP-binding protein [Candidatus Goldiibacteriota bacterium]